MKKERITAYHVDRHQAELDIEETVKAKLDSEGEEQAHKHAVNPPPKRKGRMAAEVRA